MISEHANKKLNLNKMITFDSFTIVPTYSDTPTRSGIDVSTTVAGVKSDLPIINANMLSICTIKMIEELCIKNNTFSSYHRFFQSDFDKENTIDALLNFLGENSNKFWMSVGAKPSEYITIAGLYSKGIRNVIIDTNHGHHKFVKDTVEFIKREFHDMVVMAGNVCSTDGIKFLVDAGADIIKVGNSYGQSCTTRFATGFGVHPLHACAKYRFDTGDMDTLLCSDGGFRHPSDIAKALIFSDLVMLGRMFAGTNESAGYRKELPNVYFGNASINTKKIISTNDETNHIRYIEGQQIDVEKIGPMSNLLDSIKDGLQSAFSFVNAKNLKEYQMKAIYQILEV